MDGKKTKYSPQISYYLVNGPPKNIGSDFLDDFIEQGKNNC